jgi:K+-transporting ATPase ATPase C chain
MPSSGSNLSATNKDLVAKVGGLRDSLTHIHPNSPKVPDDLLFASGSGLDPHISPEAALYQIERIAAARGMDAAQKDKLTALVNSHVESQTFKLLGEPRVNVLDLNIALDSLKRINP